MNRTKNSKAVYRRVAQLWWQQFGTSGRRFESLPPTNFEPASAEVFVLFQPLIPHVLPLWFYWRIGLSFVIFGDE